MLRINSCIYIKQRVLWAFALILTIMTTAMAAETTTNITAQTVIVVNKYGMGAPFLISWIPIWIFALAGGIGSNFIKMPEIDKHFRYLLVAKPFLGVCGGIALCLLVSDGSEPPEIALTAYALGAALLSAPILQTVLAVITIPKNQAGIINSINPFKFKIVMSDDSKENTHVSSND